MGSTTELRRALKARFFPHVIDGGFVVDQRSQPAATTFRRPVESRVQMFELRWDKYGRPRFVISFGTCPAKGLEVDGRRFAPGETFPTWCPDAGTLQPRRGTGTRAWFRQDATLLQRLRGSPALRKPAVVVDELLALFPELERYWDTGVVGSHLRLWHPGEVLPSGKIA